MRMGSQGRVEREIRQREMEKRRDETYDGQEESGERNFVDNDEGGVARAGNCFFGKNGRACRKPEDEREMHTRGG